MNLFISYPHDDKAWVHELWRALRDRPPFHDAWIDERLLAAQVWWSTILDNIEQCECVIYVLTPKSVESIYCRAEVDYARALNKPILPLIFRECAYPSALKDFQFHRVQDGEDLRDVLLTISGALSEIRVQNATGLSPKRTARRPDEPKAVKKPEQIAEVFNLGEDAAAAKNYSLAQAKYQQVIDADPTGRYGKATARRLAEIEKEADCYVLYREIAEMAQSPARVGGARALAQDFVSDYPAHDPDGVIAQLLRSARPLPTPAPVSPKLPSSSEILPKPFAWIDIPAGRVTFVPDDSDKKLSYLKQNTTFDVPAFVIAKYPVTNAQFAKFISANGYADSKWWTTEGWQTKAGEGWSEPSYRKDDKWNLPDYPVVGVSWFEALAFCAWLSATTGERITLPTEQQWPRAAQGDTNWAYPWGDKFDKNRCNFNTQGTTPVTQYEGKGDSPFGVVDMSGNVWEWCLTDYESGSQNGNISAKYRVLRGGSWSNYDGVLLRADYRNWSAPYLLEPQWGFSVGPLLILPSPLAPFPNRLYITGPFFG